MQYDLRSPARRHLGSRNLLSRPAYKVPWLIVSFVGANLYLTQHRGKIHSLMVFSRIGMARAHRSWTVYIHVYYPLIPCPDSFDGIPAVKGCLSLFRCAPDPAIADTEVR